MKTVSRRIGLPLMILAFIVLFCANTIAEEALSFPEITETECQWDSNGDLISETAHDLSGAPAVNSRGFYKAVYTWDGNHNLLSETYYGLNGRLAVIDKGYARAEYTYYTDRQDESHILTEDRYDAEGNRAEITGEYSYRRDMWTDDDNILYSKYYNAEGELTRPNGGYAQILYDINADGSTTTITKRYQDADGSPLIGSEGGETVVSVYTAKAYLSADIRVEHLDLDMMLPEVQKVQREENDYEPILLSREIQMADGKKVLGSDR